MVYQWKIPIAPVSAQTAGEEFERLYKAKGRLAPEDVVDASREETAPLHCCFEWNDEIAAEKYRIGQAGNIIRALVTVEPEEPRAQETRAFVHVRRDYHPLNVVVQDRDMVCGAAGRSRKRHGRFREKVQLVETAVTGTYGYQQLQSRSNRLTYASG